jgi:RNA polymerase sigma factor (sigma-70 family)
MAIETLGAALQQINRLFADGAVTGLSDAQLLERFVGQRDATSFEALVARHGPMVLSVCRGILRDPNDAEDAFQATFLILVKKAGLIGGRVVLGGWLYQVAHRVAIQANIATARRRAHEREAGQMATTSVSSGLTIHDDLLSALHEEIARLPAKYRLAVVLCDLEGLPQAQAAGQLHWSERTLRRRLAQARERLKAHLGRRGLAPDSALLGALFLREARFAVPSAWHEATVRAARELVNHTLTAGAVSAAAGSLTRDVLKIMLWQKLKLASAAILGAGLVTWWASAAWISRGDKPRKVAEVQATVTRREARDPAPRPDPDPDPLDETGTFPVHGRVLDPDGKPVAGAEVYVFHRINYNGVKETDPRYRAGRVTVCDVDGRFQFELDKSASDFPSEGAAWREARIAAVAPGFGAAWVDAGMIAQTGEAALRLVRDDVPIRGRVLDTQGRPVPGAAIKVAEIHVPKEGRDLDAMLASGEYESYQSDESFPSPTWLGRQGSAIAGADGRFEITGVGRDRIAGLEVTGLVLAKVVLYAMARPSKTNAKPRPRPSFPPGVPKELVPPPVPHLVGSMFDVVAGPTKLILGIVRLKGKSKPIAGVRVFGFEYASGIQTGGMTDAEGRFRLVGLPKAGAYQLRFEPRSGEPYLGAVADLTDTPGLVPIEANVELLPGVPVRGRLIDEATGKPVRAMSVTHMNLPTNLHEGHAGLEQISLAAKSFLITVPPGEGLFLASVPGFTAPFTQARLRKEDKGKGVAPHWLFGINAYKIVDVPADARNFSLELKLTRGKSREGRLIDPEGRPIAGAGSFGLRARWGIARTLDADTFEVNGLDPGHPRRVIFTHQDRKLVGAVVLKDEDMNSNTPLVVKLVPGGSITGRLVDDDGLPLARAKLNVMNFDLDGMNLPFRGPGALWPSNETFTVDADGRFRVEGFVPGVETDVSIDAPTRPNVWLDPGETLRKLIVNPGEVRNLGDVKVHVVPR